MLSAPVFDSCEGPKQQGAIADAIFEKKFSPRTLHTPRGAPPFSTFWRRGSENLFFRKPPRHCAALVHIVSEGACMPNRSRFGASTAVEAATIVHDVRYVT
jgi:hypothetical protein